jgi:hypothetical protein
VKNEEMPLPSLRSYHSGITIDGKKKRLAWEPFFSA